MLRTLVRAGLALLFAASIHAQGFAATQAPAPAFPVAERDPLHAPGSEVTVSLLTMGNGTEVWEMFGHAAIWIHDDRMNRDTVFNWGVFNMREPNFILHFLQGLNWYQMGGDSMQQVMLAYQYWKRSVTAQELNLSASQKDSLLRIIQVNAQPENLKYRYDYFVDNCATKPRDILDRVLGGQLRVGADSLSGTSYRWHALRLMQDDTPLALGVNIGLGEPSDRPITKWETMFLPRQLHDWVATRQIRDSTGALVPLVKRETILYQAPRPAEHDRPPSFAWLWPVGAVIAALFAWIGVSSRRKRGARVTGAVVFAIWAATCGILGILLAMLWAVTDHRFAHANENLLLFNPLWLILAVTLPMTMLRGRAAKLTKGLLLSVAGLAALALLSHVVGLSRQSNIPIIGLGLLPAAALLFAARQAPAESSAG